MNGFKYINQDYIPSVDLNTLGNTFSTLEQGHKEAVKAASDLEIAMANYDLNEQENEWRQQKINEIKQVIDDNTVYGNSYAALDDLIMKAGDIQSDQGLIGRLKYQKEFKDFKNRIETDKTLPQDYKDYFIANNKYNYKDVVDKNGKVIGYTSFTPDVNPTTVVPLNVILDNALKWAAKESGGSNIVRWLDENGNITTNPTASSTGEYLDSTTNTWQRLSKSKLRAAVDASINSIPGAKESLQQDYNVAKWKHDNGRPSDILSKDGTVLPPQQYLEKRINPFYEAATYYNQSTSVSYGNAVKANLELQSKNRQQETSAGIDDRDFRSINDNLVVKTTPIRYVNTSAVDAQSIITNSKQTISNILGVDVSTMSDKDMNAKAMELPNPMDKLKVRQALDDIKDQQSYLNSIVEGQGKEVSDKFKAYNDIMSLSVGDSSNPAYAKFAEKVNRLYDGKQEIFHTLYNDTEIKNFYDYIGGRDKALSLGIVERVVDGNTRVVLPYDKRQSIYAFASALNKVANEYSFMDNIFGIGKTMRNKYAATEGIIPKDVKYLYNPILDYVDNLEKTTNDIIKNKTIVVSPPAIAASTPEAALTQMKIKSGIGQTSDNKAALDIMDKEAYAALRAIDLVQEGAFVEVDGYFQKADQETRRKLTGVLRSADDSKLNAFARVDPTTGKFGIQVNIAATYDSDNKLVHEAQQFFIPSGGVDNKIFQEWNRNTEFRAINDVSTMSSIGQPITIVSPNLFGSNELVTAVNVGNGYVLKSGDKVLNKHLTTQDVVDLRDNFLQWRDTYNALAAGTPIKQESLEAIMDAVSTNIANIFDGSQEAKLYWYTNMAKAIMQ